MTDRQLEDGGETVEFTVQIADITAFSSPLSGEEWGCDPIDPVLVIDAAEHFEFETDDWQTVNRRNRGRAFDHFRYHVRRLAFLYSHPDDTPIEIEVERYEDKARIRVYDGNHRLGSAILRGDVEIGIAVPMDDVEDFLSMVPTAVPNAPRANSPTGAPADPLPSGPKP